MELCWVQSNKTGSVSEYMAMKPPMTLNPFVPLPGVPGKGRDAEFGLKNIFRKAVIRGKPRFCGRETGSD